MACVGVVGFLATLPQLIKLGTETDDLIDKSLDLITITVPPALPAAMSVGVAFAIQRLKRSQIFCISPPRVNICGMIQIMVFDKTGTLTEDGLQILGLRGIKQNQAANIPAPSSPPETVGNAQDYIFTGFVEDIIELCHQEKRDHQISDQVLQLYEAMASCHAITFINNDLIGDPLEIKMFQSTRWALEEQNLGGNSNMGAE